MRSPIIDKIPRNVNLDERPKLKLCLQSRFVKYLPRDGGTKFSFQNFSFELGLIHETRGGSLELKYLFSTSISPLHYVQ